MYTVSGVQFYNNLNIELCLQGEESQSQVDSLKSGHAWKISV